MVESPVAVASGIVSLCSVTGTTLPVLAFSTSALIIRPLGPVPEIVARSTPFCSAIRRARGLDFMREPSLAFGASCLGSAAAGLVELSALGTSEACSFCCDSTASVFSDGALTSFTSSPSSAITAITVPTFTLSVPAGTSNLAMTPSSIASNSIVALSVSISAKRSPDDTLSPSLTSHLARVPSSIVGERAGI